MHLGSNRAGVFENASSLLGANDSNLNTFHERMRIARGNCPTPTSPDRCPEAWEKVCERFPMFYASFTGAISTFHCCRSTIFPFKHTFLTILRVSWASSSQAISLIHVHGQDSAPPLSHQILLDAASRFVRRCFSAPPRTINGSTVQSADFVQRAPIQPRRNR